MNKNKIIFLAIWVWVLVLIIVLFIFLSSAWKKARTTTTTSQDGFKIWVLNDDKTKFWDIMKDFKDKYPQYKNENFSIVTFTNYDEYYNSLVWAFLRWVAPDIFVLNNNDSNFFDLQVLWLDPVLVSPDEFRKNFDSVFSQDLIRKVQVDDKTVEFLAWIPIWYETLGLFYNFREIKWKKLSTWSYINDVIRELRENNASSWIWIWNWTTVYDAWDIITQFFLLDGIVDLFSATWNNLKSSLSNYARYWDENMDNKYNSFYSDLITNNKNNLDLFSSWDIQMVLGYPRMIQEIDKKWFNKWFLRAEPFPTYKENNGKLLVNYNYFVINKNTSNQELAWSILQYLSTPEAQSLYLKSFEYYMPAMLSLVADRLEENIKSWYNIKYKNFYNPDLELTSFDKKLRTVYDKEISLILDSWINSTVLFENFRKRLLCLSNKMVLGEWLETSCNK